MWQPAPPRLARPLPYGSIPETTNFDTVQGVGMRVLFAAILAPSTTGIRATSDGSSLPHSSVLMNLNQVPWSAFCQALPGSAY